MELHPNSNDVLFHSFRQQYAELSPKEMALLEGRKEGEMSLPSDDTKSYTDSSTRSPNDSVSNKEDSDDSTRSASWQKGLRVLERRQKSKGAMDASLALSEESHSGTYSSAFHSKVTGDDSTKGSSTEHEEISAPEPANLFEEIMKNLSHPSQLLGISTSSSAATSSDRSMSQEEDVKANLEILKHGVRLTSPVGISFDMIDFNDIKANQEKRNEKEDAPSASQGNTYTTAEDLKVKFQGVLPSTNPIDQATFVESTAVSEDKDKKWLRRKTEVIRAIMRSKSRIVARAQMPFQKLKGRFPSEHFNGSGSYRKVSNDLNTPSIRIQSIRMKSIFYCPNASMASTARKSLAPLNASLISAARHVRSSTSGAMTSLRRSRFEKYEDVGENYTFGHETKGCIQTEARTEARQPEPQDDDHMSNVFGMKDFEGKDTSRGASPSPAPAILFSDNGEIETAVKEKAVKVRQYESGAIAPLSAASVTAAAGGDAVQIEVVNSEAKIAPKNIQSRRSGDSPTLELLLGPIHSSKDLKTNESMASDTSRLITNDEGLKQASSPEFKTMQSVLQSRQDVEVSKDVTSESELADEITPQDPNESDLVPCSHHGKAMDMDKVPPRNMTLALKASGKSQSSELIFELTSCGHFKKPPIEVQPFNAKIIERFNRVKADSISGTNVEPEIEILRNTTQVTGVFEWASSTVSLETGRKQVRMEYPILPLEKKAPNWRKSLVPKLGNALAAGATNEETGLELSESDRAATSTNSSAVTSGGRNHRSRSEIGSPRKSRKRLNKLPLPKSVRAVASDEAVNVSIRTRKSDKPPSRRRQVPQTRHGLVDSLGVEPQLENENATQDRHKAIAVHQDSKYSDKACVTPQFLPLSHNPIIRNAARLVSSKGVTSSVVVTNDTGVEMVANTFTSQEDDQRDDDNGNVLGEEEVPTDAADELDIARTKKKRNSIIEFLKPKRKPNCETGKKDENEGSAHLLTSENQDFPNEEAKIERNAGTASVVKGQGYLPPQLTADYSVLSTVIDETLPDATYAKGSVFDMPRMIGEFFMAAMVDVDSLDSGDEETLSKVMMTKSPGKWSRRLKVPFLDDDSEVHDSFEEEDSALSSPTLLNQILTFQQCTAVCHDRLSVVHSEDVSSVTSSTTGGSSEDDRTDRDRHSGNGVVVERNQASLVSSREPAHVDDTSNEIPSEWVQFPYHQHKPLETIEKDEEKKKPKRGVTKRLLSLVKRNWKADGDKVMTECTDKDRVDEHPNIHGSSFVSVLSEDASSSRKSNGSDVFSGVASNGGSQKWVFE